MTSKTISEARRNALRARLPAVQDLLQRNRASEIGEAVIDELVELCWLEWDGGSLQVTATGGNICRQVLRSA